MCGIFGIIGAYNLESVKHSLNIMQNRGINSSKIVEFANGCFAQNRLAIIAPSPQYNPPFSYNKNHFVFNGEIYNHQELNKTSISDSQTAFEYSMQNLDKFLNKADGMFAFALYNEDSKKLVLARDRFGKKPLYYTLYNGTFIFASSLDAITNHIKAEFNKYALKSYLTFRSVIAQETFYKNIYKLEAGHKLTYSNNEIETEQYFDFFNAPKPKENLQDIIYNAITQRLNTNTKIASLLSGGVDSSTIAAVASKFLKQSNKRLETFCIGYKGYEKDDERYFASISAKKFNTIHNEIEFGKNDFLDSLENVIAAFDEPIADQAAIPLNYMCKQINANDIKCILSGEGADEAFLGYKKYEEFLKLNSAKNLPFASYLDGYFERHFEQSREWEWFKRVFGGEILYRNAGELYTDKQKIAALNQKVSNTYSKQKLQKYYQDFTNYKKDDYSIWMSYIDIKIWLGEVLLQKADKIGMHNSIEIRAPFMDYKLLKKSLELGDLRLKNGTKSILKNYIKDTLPNEILNRDKKGFTHPFNKWLFELADPDIIFTLNAKTQFFNKKYLDFLFNNAKKGSFKHQFWAIYIFSKWYIKRFGL